MINVNTNRPQLKVLSAPTAYTDLSDKELVLACQNNDARAFHVLFKRHERYVHGLIYKLAPDWINQQDDLAQEAFIRVWRSIRTLKNPNAFKGWLNQVVTNLFYDELRKRPRVPVTSLDEPYKNDEGESTTKDIADFSGQPDDLYERHEIINHVNAAIQALPEQFRNVIVLRELHGLPYDEIAAITKSEIGTVKSRIARARTKMQPSLNPLRCA